MSANIEIFKNVDIWSVKKGIVVIPVNCQGIMGKGLARQCKERHPQIHRHYRHMCLNSDFSITSLKMFLLNDDYAILLFPTKKQWRNPSRLEWIDANLGRLATIMTLTLFPALKTLHIPPLGCGEGGLDINEVYPLIKQHLCDVDCKVCLYTDEKNSI